MQIEKQAEMSEEMRRYVIGKRYEVERIADAQIRFTEPTRASKFGRMRERLAEEYSITPGVIFHYWMYARAIDVIAKAAPEFHELIMSGELKVTQGKVIELGKSSPERIRLYGAELMQNPAAYWGFVNAKGELIHKTPNSVMLAQMQLGAIKEMPKHDPDAEIMSLALTIPSWAGSMNRVYNTTKFDELSDDAKKKIACELDRFCEAIDKLYFAIEEVE